MEFTVTQLLIDPPPDLWYVLLREPHGFFQRKSPTVLKIKAKEDNWVIMKTKKIRQKKNKNVLPPGQKARSHFHSSVEGFPVMNSRGKQNTLLVCLFVFAALSRATLHESFQDKR